MPKSGINTAPKTHPWRLARAGPRSASVLRDRGLHEPLQVASLSRPRERAPERGGDSAGLRRGPAHASAPRQLRPSCPSARPASHPQRPSGRGLTSPPTPSGSAFPRCAGRSGPAYTSSRRPGARSLCGGPWRGKRGQAAGAAQAAAGLQGQALPRPHRLEGGGSREAEQTRTSPAAGSAHQRSRDPGSFAGSFRLPFTSTPAHCLEASRSVAVRAVACPFNARFLPFSTPNQFSGWNWLHGAFQEAGASRPCRESLRTRRSVTVSV